MREVDLIGVASGWGARDHGCEEGPAQLQLPRMKILYPGEKPYVPSLNRKLAHSVYKSMKRGHLPVVFGGDHSIAVGTWNGVNEAYRGHFGLIWIDAHMDSHTPATSPSQARHGMPLAALLGFGEPDMAKLLHDKPVLKPAHTVLIGVRSFEEGELEFLRSHHVRIYMMEEVKERGLEAILNEATEYLEKRVDHFGVSIDLDVIDPEVACGFGSPEPGGFSKEEFLDCVTYLSRHQNVLAFEIVEFNPRRDFGGKTKAICLEALDVIEGGEEWKIALP